MNTLRMTVTILSFSMPSPSCTKMEAMPGPGSGGQSSAWKGEFAPVCGAKGHKFRSERGSLHRMILASLVS
jgi:hypothetical protein